jgi:hypothetical protein
LVAGGALAAGLPGVWALTALATAAVSVALLLSRSAVVLIALSAALLIGIQFWHPDRGGVYVLWYLPLVLLMVFRPNLTAAEPPAAEAGAGLMARLAGAAWRRVRGPRPEPPKELAV